MRSDRELMFRIDKLTFHAIEESNQLLAVYEKGFEEKTNLDWAIVLKNTDQFIGTIGYHHISFETARAEIGYVLLFPYHKRGLISEAMKVVLEYGFKTIGIQSIIADVNPENEASKKLLTKFGFTLEAHIKQNFEFNNKYLDSYIYKLINPYG